MPLGEQLLQMSNTSHKINVYPMFQKDFHELYVLALLQLIQFQFLISLKFFLPKKFGKRSGNSIEHFEMSKLLSFHRFILGNGSHLHSKRCNSHLGCESQIHPTLCSSQVLAMGFATLWTHLFEVGRELQSFSSSSFSLFPC
jgi:hypothetical protein